MSIQIKINQPGNIPWTDSDGSTQSTPYGDAIVCTPPTCTDEYIRPSDWLDMDGLVDGDDEVWGLYAVWEDQVNLVACQAYTSNSSDYQVDWGDGNVTTHTSGTIAEHEFDFTDLSPTTLSSRGYRQSKIVVTAPTNTLLSWSTNCAHSLMTTRYASGWLDIRMASQTINTLASVCRLQYNQYQLYLERFEFVGTCIATSTTYMHYQNNLLFCKGNFDLVTDATYMFSYSNVQWLDMTLLASNVSLTGMFMGANTQIITGLDARNTNGMASFARSSDVTQIGTEDDPFILNNNISMATIAYQAYNLREVYFGGVGGPTSLNQAFRACYIKKAVFGTLANCTSMSLAFYQNYCLSEIDCTDLAVTTDFTECDLSLLQMTDIANAVGDGTGQTITFTNNPETIDAPTTTILTDKNWTVVP